MNVVIVLAFVLVACSDSGDSESDSSVNSDSPGYITMEEIYSEGSDSGTFTATGSAICDSGTTTHKDWWADETQWWYEVDFRCKDGTGEFIVKGELPPLPDEPATLEGTWRKVVGNGDYSGATISGAMTVTTPGAPPPPATPWRESTSYVGEMTLSEG